jgi:hypothetical protein
MTSTALIELRDLPRAIEAIRTAEDGHELKGKIDGLLAYLRSQEGDQWDAIFDLSYWRLETICRIGELLPEGPGPGRPKKLCHRDTIFHKACEEAGIPLRTGYRYKFCSTVPAKDRQRLGSQEAREARQTPTQGALLAMAKAQQREIEMRKRAAALADAKGSAIIYHEDALEFLDRFGDGEVDLLLAPIPVRSLPISMLSLKRISTYRSKKFLCGPTETPWARVRSILTS